MQGADEQTGLEALCQQISALRAQVEQEGLAQYRRWQPYLKRPPFDQAARNLADYLALRKHDLRPLQRELARLGLSSLGRAESRVRENLNAVLAARAECVMLNKGPYLHQGIRVLSEVLRRMQDHQYKKTPKMRPLKAWSQAAR